VSSHGIELKESKKIAITYYGWKDEPIECKTPNSSELPAWINESALSSDEMPFK